MNDLSNPSPFAWDLIRTFLAVAETVSFTAAAKALGSSQPTVGRQIAELLGRRHLQKG